MTSEIPSYDQIAVFIAQSRTFALVLDAPDGRHVFVHHDRGLLLGDVIGWLKEVPGPATFQYMASVTAAITPLECGQTAYLQVVPWHRAHSA
jgi:hypothetical protein